MRKRKVVEENYRSIFTDDGVTMRFRIDQSKPFAPMKNPDLLDISLNTLCYANCAFCYTSAVKTGNNYLNVVEKFKRFFEPLNEHRPYQVAFGGGGEPTLHPEFCEILRVSKELDIMPNYTTNGMHLTDKVLDASAQYCGGVAVSAHRHLKWEKAVEKLLNRNIRTNLHVIVGEPNSFEYLMECHHKFPNLETIVILPYQVQGRASEIDEKICVDNWIASAKMVNENQGFKFAFGALFYDFMLNNPQYFPDVQLYEPEIFSGYLMLDDNPVIRKSSYNLDLK